MEIKAGNVHFARHPRSIQAIQTTKDARLHFRVDLCGSPRLPELGKSLAPEASDHGGMM
jgi:hypothetical protein